MIIIFSGFNMRAVYAFLRTLEKHHLSYAIIASSENDEVFETSYKNKVVTIRDYLELDLDDVVKAIKQVQLATKSSNYFIAPSTEALNRFLVENRERIEALDCIIPLVEKSMYEEISDKYKFGDLCNTFDITTPAEYSMEDINLPCVAKPRTYFGKKSNRILKPVIIQFPDDLEIFLAEHDIEEFYFQEFISGKSLYLLYYFYQDEACLKYSQENLIQQRGGGSILAAKSSDFHLSDYSKCFDDQMYMIEANPRFWGPSQLFVDAGINFFEALLYDYGFLNKQPESAIAPHQLIYYFWDDGESFIGNAIDTTAFHDYSKQQFLIKHDDLNKINILKKRDTMAIYNKLIQGNKNEK